jgi:release factor glutamine methyltransferase
MSEPAGEPRVEPWTVARVIAWAAADFRARGIASARLDAELLLAHALGVERIRLFIDSTRRLTPDDLAGYRALIQRRRQREPVAYILGEREFWGLPLRVDRRVLIPRPDTETLVEVALARTRHRDLCGEALDLCTGSGCVAIAFARARPTWRVTGTDLDPGAVALARENAQRLGAVWGVGFVTSDLDAALGGSRRFDLLTANPPYIASGEVAALDAGIRDFEPLLALDGGADGLAVVRRIVDRAALRLRPRGVLAVEVGAGQSDAVAELMAQGGLQAIETARDYGGVERVVSGRLTA